MPLYTRDASALIQPMVRGEFHAAYSRRLQAAILPKICTTLTGDLETLPFGWLGNVPLMRQYSDERHVKTLNSYDYNIGTLDWEDTVEFSRNLVEDERFPAVMIRIRDLATECVNARTRYIVKNVYAANMACYDGQPIFSASHPIPGGTYSNTTATALSATALQTAIASMEATVDDQGEPMGIQATTLLVGPALKFTAMGILNSEFLVGYGGGTNTLTPSKNVMEGVLDLVETPYLTGPYANYWIVLDTTREIQGAIFYERSDIPIEVTIRSAPDSSPVFERNMIQAGARARWGAAPGLWQTAYAGIL